MAELNGSAEPLNPLDQKHIEIKENRRDKCNEIPIIVIRSDCTGSPSLSDTPQGGVNEKPSEPSPRPLDPSDALLNPSLYEHYAQYIPVDDFADTLVKKFDVVKDLTRDKAVSSISAGERAIIWTYNTLKYLSKRWFTHFLLLVIILAYNLIGATIFMVLEGPYEELYDMQLNDVRKDFASKLEKIVRNETVMKTNTNLLELIQNDLIAYEDSYSECMKHVNNNNTTQKSWNFWNSMVFAGTIYTTIGYGHITPKTTSGRFATIIYAIIGIPLFLIVLTDFGKLLTRIIKFLWAYIRRYYYRRKFKKARRKFLKERRKKNFNNDLRATYHGTCGEDMNKSNTDQKKPPQTNLAPPNDPALLEAPSIYQLDEISDEFNLPISLAITILIMYMIFGAFIINFWEKWGFFEAFYYVFISMSTIGLGDFVSNYPLFIYLSNLYVLFGLSLTTMCITVVQQKISDALKNTKFLENISD